MANADEIVAGFDKDKDLPVLNEELRKMQQDINNHTHDDIYLNKTNTTAYTPTTTYHPATKGYVDGVAGSGGSVKGWASVTYSGGVPTLQDSYNVSSIVDVGVGKIRVVWDTDFASANYAVVATSSYPTGNVDLAKVLNLAATSATIENLVASDGTNRDPDAIYIMATGDQ